MFSLWGRSEISTRRMIWLGHRSLYGVAVKPKPNSYKLWQYVCICSAVLWTPSFEYQCVKKPFVLRSLMPFIMRGRLSNLLLKHQNRLFISVQSKPPNTFVNHFDDLSGWSHCLLKCSVEPSNLFALLCILEINCHLPAISRKQDLNGSCWHLLYWNEPGSTSPAIPYV